MHLDEVMAYLERLPMEDRRVFNYEAQITRLEEEIEQYKKRKLRLYEDLADGIITKTEYTDFRNAYNKVIEDKTNAVQRMKKEQNQAAASGMGNRAWVQAFSQ